MPDPLILAKAMAAAAIAAAGMALLFRWMPFARLASIGGILGMAVGFTIGCWVLGARPQWPPREDQDRWLLILMPLAAGVELAAAWTRSANLIEPVNSAGQVMSPPADPVGATPDLAARRP